MAAFMPQVPVDKPTLEQPLRYGLFQAAIGPLPLETHMRGGGLYWYNTMCGGGQGYETNCLADLDAKVFNEAGLDIVVALPFVVLASYTCAPNLGVDEMERLTRQKLHSIEQSVVEQAFSDSLFGMSPGLANNPDVVTVASGATELVDVIGELENALYCTSQYGPPGVLHVPFVVFERMKSEHLIEFSNGRWRTAVGTVVSTGCYSGNEPDGDAPAAGTFWIYITGQTVVWRTAQGEEEIVPVEGSLNRTTNQYTGVAEREYVVGFECGVYALPVTLWTVAP